MDIHGFIHGASPDELQEELVRLAEDSSAASLHALEEFLRYHGRTEKTEHEYTSISFTILVPRLPALALLQKGPGGVQALVRSLTEKSGAGSDAFAALWWAAKGKIMPDPLLRILKVQIRDELVQTLTPETIQASRDAVNRLVIEARTNPQLFGHLLQFLASSYQAKTVFGEEGIGLDEFYEMMTSGAIKLSLTLLHQFEGMIQRELREEEYQCFLNQHPVFLDALAADVIPKQALGIEFVTDFVLRRYDNKYVLVEIEKPQDRLFTLRNDFTSEFTHAFGQVLDFQQWIDSNGAYARVHMPGISSPRGLLVMGRRSHMTEQNEGKLHRFSANSPNIDIVTFDDILQNATRLYQAILRKSTPANK